MKKFQRVVTGAAAVAGFVAASSAHATTTIDLTPITGAFTAADVTVGVVAVAGTLAVIYATIKASKIALGMLRGG